MLIKLYRYRIFPQKPALVYEYQTKEIHNITRIHRRSEYKIRKQKRSTISI